MAVMWYPATTGYTASFDSELRIRQARYPTIETSLLGEKNRNFLESTDLSGGIIQLQYEKGEVPYDTISSYSIDNLTNPRSYLRNNYPNTQEYDRFMTAQTPTQDI